MFEKPKVSIWMIFIPILFLYFIFRMQKFKNDRIKFDEEFMRARRKAMDVALGASAADRISEIGGAAQYPELPAPLQKPYAAWIKTLSSHYLDLLSADGDDFESLIRKAYCNRENYLLTLDRLNNAEKEFYAALKPLMAQVEGTAKIISTIESESRRLRSETAYRIFH
ncbi:MAG: hypothetical protein EHM30_10740 [Desulfobacteraceae bacterium]|nr:MAG: hypothetical protein EHM30_10740 [Desulfobacteraceae bacterium]